MAFQDLHPLLSEALTARGYVTPTPVQAAVLEPEADGFRNHLGEGHDVPAEHLVIVRAARLTLSGPEMTVLLPLIGRAKVSARLAGDTA